MFGFWRMSLLGAREGKPVGVGEEFENYGVTKVKKELKK